MVKIYQWRIIYMLPCYIAQMIKYWPRNPVVMGSNPIQGTAPVFFSINIACFGCNALPCFILSCIHVYIMEEWSNCPGPIRNTEQNYIAFTNVEWLKK